MRFTRAVMYAVHALAYMATHEQKDQQASHDVAHACAIPERFLLKVLKPLVSARVLFSLRGPHGGYRLARPAKDITLLEIVEALDGPIGGQDLSAEFRCGPGLQDRLQVVADRTADLLRSELRKVRLSDLMAKRK